MPTIQPHHGYEILNCPLGQQRSGNLVGRSLFRLWFSASEIVRFDCHRAVFWAFGAFARPVNWRAGACFLLPERGLILATLAQTGAARQTVDPAVVSKTAKITRAFWPPFRMIMRSLPPICREPVLHRQSGGRRDRRDKRDGMAKAVLGIIGGLRLAGANQSAKQGH